MHRNRPETGRRAPRSLPRPRPLRLPPCRCGLFRRTQEVPRRSPATSFGRGPPRSMSGTESPQDGPSVPLERNDRPVRRGGGLRAAFTMGCHQGCHAPEKRSGQGHSMQFPPFVCGEGSERGGRRERKFWVFALVEAAGHICGVCAVWSSDGAAARARRGPPGNLVAGQPGVRRALRWRQQRHSVEAFKGSTVWHALGVRPCSWALGGATGGDVLIRKGRHI